MKLLNISILLVFVMLSHATCAQSTYYIKASMGPKLEQYKVVGNSNVQALQHLDVGAGASIGKFIKPNIYAELSIWKNDYTSKLAITSYNAEGEELTGFTNQLYPTHSSTQLGGMVGYTKQLSKSWSWYAQGGLNLFLSKKLEREGSQLYQEIIGNEKSGYKENIDVIAFSNGLEGGNLIFRGDVGLIRVMNKDFSIDVSLIGRASNLVVAAYEIEYSTTSEPQPRRAKIENSASGFGLYVGLRYNLIKDE